MLKKVNQVGMNCVKDLSKYGNLLKYLGNEIKNKKQNNTYIKFFLEIF